MDTAIGKSAVRPLLTADTVSPALRNVTAGAAWERQVRRNKIEVSALFGLFTF
jgi:hypothetical protein